MEHIKEKYKKLLGIISLVVFYMSLGCVEVFAGGLKDSTIVKGTETLLKDITTWLMILAPILTIVLLIYFFIRRSAADEQDQKRWNNRITTAIISCIGAIIASALLNLIIGYYK